MAPLRRLARDERGGAMVEFALVAPILFLVMLGIFEFGRAWHVYHTITDAAREGARKAVIFDGEDKVGDADTPGTVPAAVLTRLWNAGMITTDAWAPNHYTADCTGWNPPTPSADADTPSIYGCGWGTAAGPSARVVVYAPYPFAFVRTMMGLFNADIAPTVLQTDYVMRNE